MIIERLGIKLDDKEGLLGRIDSSFAEEEFEPGVMFVSGLFSLFDCLKSFHCVFLASRVGKASF